MSVQSPQPPEEPAANPLLEEAIFWCLRMNGEDAEAHRAAFDAWLALGGVHRQIYSEISELYGFGERLRPLDIGLVVPPEKRVPLPAVISWWRSSAWMVVLLIAIAFGAIIMGRFDHSASRSTFAERAERKTGQMQTALGEIRTVRLGDGSSLTLDTDSLVSFAIDRRARQLRLERGRVRLRVAQDKRAFTVLAGAGQVAVSPSLLDIALNADQRITISVLRGSADLRSGDKWSAIKPSQRVHLAVGYRASFGTDTGISVARLARAEIAGNSWPSGLISFDGVPLSQVIQQANRYGVMKIYLADPMLGHRRFHGTLRLNDTRRVALIIAQAFSLHLGEDAGALRLSSQ